MEPSVSPPSAVPTTVSEPTEPAPPTATPKPPVQLKAHPTVHDKPSAPKAEAPARAVLEKTVVSNVVSKAVSKAVTPTKTPAQPLRASSATPASTTVSTPKYTVGSAAFETYANALCAADLACAAALKTKGKSGAHSEFTQACNKDADCAATMRAERVREKGTRAGLEERR